MPAAKAAGNKAVAVTLYRALLRTARSFPTGRQVMLTRKLVEHDASRSYHLKDDLWGGFAENVFPPFWQQHRPADPLLDRAEIESLIRRIRASTSAAAESSADQTESTGDVLDQGFTALRLLSEVVDMAQRCSVAETDGLRVSAVSQHMPALHHNNLHFHHYKVRIDNKGEHTVQLKGRHWLFCRTNEAGEPQEVLGEVPKYADGVVGKQPIIRPGQAFEYCSFAPMTATRAVMSGCLQFEIVSGPGGVEGEVFEAEVAPLHLTVDGVHAPE